ACGAGSAYFRWRGAGADTPQKQKAEPPLRACTLSGPADGDAVHTQGRLADADGHGLAILAASANAGIELEVISDHADAVEVGRTIADQHGALERLRKLATLDLVGLGNLKNVLARSDIDLAAAEIDGIDAVLDRGDDLTRRMFAGEHVSIGHARHRRMGIALPAAIACGFHAHQTRVVAVLHVADED